jgi:hypothetical protein
MLTNVVQDAVMQLLPARRKRSNDWISFNAVCCTHNGETPDTRGRGGIIPATDGAVSYHCFNCGFKVSYRPGWALSYKFRKLLSWLGADENTVRRLVLEAVRVRELVAPEQVPEPERKIEIKPRGLPEGVVSLKEWATYISLQSQEWNMPRHLIQAVDYLASRDPGLLDRYDFYLTDDESYNLHKRVIVPFYLKGQLMGYTARAFDDSVKPKYHSNYEPGFVFNLDRQTPDRKFVIVVEGPFDAMAVDGIAVLSNECSEVQADQIDDLARTVIVVPDFDTHVDKRGRSVWSGSRLVDQAIEYGWNVSFPVWRETCKDVAEAVQKYGRLFVIKSIIDAQQSSRLKIELMKKKIHT